MCVAGISDGKSYWTNVKYNELATLTYVSQDKAINHLLSRGTHKQYSPLGTITTTRWYLSLTDHITL